METKLKRETSMHFNSERLPRYGERRAMVREERIRGGMMANRTDWVTQFVPSGKGEGGGRGKTTILDTFFFGKDEWG